MSAEGIRHFLDLIDIPKAELRGMIDAAIAMKARGALRQYRNHFALRLPSRDASFTLTHVHVDLAAHAELALEINARLNREARSRNEHS